MMLYNNESEGGERRRTANLSIISRVPRNQMADLKKIWHYDFPLFLKVHASAWFKSLQDGSNELIAALAKRFAFGANEWRIRQALSHRRLLGKEAVADIRSMFVPFADFWIFLGLSGFTTSCRLKNLRFASIWFFSSLSILMQQKFCQVKGNGFVLFSQTDSFWYQTNVSSSCSSADQS